MNPERARKTIASFDKGWISALEAANGLLFAMVSEPELDVGFLASIPSLPGPVREAFFALLDDIRRAEFRWRPSMFGVGYSDDTTFSAKLREIWRVFSGLDPSMK